MSLQILEIVEHENFIWMIDLFHLQVDLMVFDFEYQDSNSTAVIEQLTIEYTYLEYSLHPDILFTRHSEQSSKTPMLKVY